MPSESFRQEINSNSFHRSIRPLLLLGQFCGLLPVKGIFDSGISFTWGNFIHVYAFIIFIVTLFFDCCYTTDNLKMRFGMDVYASTVFYSVCLLTTIIFLQLATEFPEISKNFTQIETHMMDYGYPRRLSLKIKTFLFFFFIFAVLEHGTLVIINLNYAWKGSAKEEGSFGYLFYKSHFPAITKRLPYSGLGTFILFWVNAMCTFNWNYLDFFLIVISMETSSRFNLINFKLRNGDLQNENQIFWQKISEDYNRISLLTKKLDKKLSKVILTSFFSNMYHISLQLARSLKVNGTLFQMTYFYSSFSYLIVRLLMVLYFASKIHSESKEPFGFFFTLEKPCVEAVRFFHQVQTDDIAFTGNRFFVINTKFVASIIGTILTYQAFLLQVNSLHGNIIHNA